MWVESHQALDTSPKLKRAARQLGVSRPAVSGHLHFLWHWALDNAFDGDLSNLDSEDIADAAEWDGDSQTFVAALTDCGPGDQAGFLERDGLTADGCRAQLVIHDWWEHTKHLREKREAALQANHQRWHVQRGAVEPSCSLCCPSGDRADNGHTPDDTPPDSGGNPDGIEGEITPESDGNPVGIGREIPPESTNPPTHQTNQPTPPRAHAEPDFHNSDPQAVAGGRDPNPPKYCAERAVDRLRRGMPPPLAQRLDKQHQQAIEVVVPLALAGWQPRELADQLGQRGWDGVQDPARVLAKRAQGLAEVEPPSLRARREQARDPPGCPNDAQHGAMVDDEGRAEPCSCGWTPAGDQEAS
jgi:hypothetical protein